MIGWRSILTVMVLLALVPSPVRAQGLAAVAAKEKQRRKQPTAAPAKVYSDSDLAGSGNTSSEVVDPSGEDAAARSTSPGSSPSRIARPVAKEKSGGNEASWRRRVAEARSRIKVAETNLQGLLIRKDAASVADLMASRKCSIPEVVVRQGKEAMKRWSCVTNPKTQQAQKPVDLAERELQSAKDAWVALEEEARRSGALPGWLR